MKSLVIASVRWLAWPMAKDERRSDDDLAAAIERTRTDSQFMERLGLLVESDREILDRLAGGEPPT